MTYQFRNLWMITTIGCGLALSATQFGYAQTETELVLPKLNLEQYAPAATINTPIGVKTSVLGLTASLTAETAPLSNGVSWRIFGANKNADNTLPLIARTDVAAPLFDLPDGTYFIHAAFGRAGATKRVQINGEDKVDSFILGAGGLLLNAEFPGGGVIPPFKLKFDIYDLVEDINGNRQLVIGDVKPDSIIGLNAGTYHVVSNYGRLNAVVRSDIRVEAGKLTEATVEHRAAQIVLKLVSETGGEALADTAWSVFTESGEVVYESVGAYAPAALAEGTYTAVAKHRDQIIEHSFTVETGKDEEVELLLTL